MTRKEAIEQLINDFENKVIANDGFGVDELDVEIAKALKLEELLNKYLPKYERSIAYSEQVYQNSQFDIDRRESELAEMEGGDLY